MEPLNLPKFCQKYLNRVQNEIKTYIPYKHGYFAYKKYFTFKQFKGLVIKYLIFSNHNTCCISW